MTMSEAVVKRVNELLFEKGWSLYRLSKEACLPLTTLKNLYNGHTKSPTLSLVFKISEAFSLTPIQFLDNEVFVSDELDYL